jgi:hypothetical protein
MTPARIERAACGLEGRRPLASVAGQTAPLGRPLGRGPPALYVRLAPEDEAALLELEPAAGKRSEAMRDLLRAHAESPQVRAAFAAWRAARR